MKNSRILLIAVIFVVVGLGGLLLLFTQNSSQAFAVMSSMGDMGSMMNGNGSTLNQGSVANLQNKSTIGTINKNENKITFTSQNVSLVALAAPPQRSGDYYKIDGLINPTIAVPNRSTIHITLVNEDNIMHGFEITSSSPPYPRNVMMTTQSLFNSFIMPISGTGGTNYHTSNVTITPNSKGTYYYLCPVPKHAQMGMHGKFIVT